MGNQVKALNEKKSSLRLEMNICSLKAVFKWLNNFLIFRPLKKAKQAQTLVLVILGRNKSQRTGIPIKTHFSCIIDQLKLANQAQSLILCILVWN